MPAVRIPLLGKYFLLLLFTAGGTWYCMPEEYSLRVLWPAVSALIVIIITRHALAGLAAGAFCGAVLIAGGDFPAAAADLWTNHLLPHFSSSWKVGGLLFTLLLGGFAAVLEKGGGFTQIIKRFMREPKHASRDLQTGVFSLGILCFFDGLANSMLVGRVGRQSADACGVSRAKLAYIVDSTSSAVACVAFISTWIAAQLSYIESSFAGMGQDVNPLLYFWQSLPYNFYCWFALILLWISIRFHFNPGPMQRLEDKAAGERSTSAEYEVRGTMASALIPLLVLLISMLLGLYFLGLREIGGGEGLSFIEKLTAAMGASSGPTAMVFAGVIAVIAAAVMFPETDSKWTQVHKAFSEGAVAMLMPLLILIAAWMMGSVMTGLGVADWVSSIIGSNVPLAVIPASIFIVGAFMSFVTGTSWGTMGMLMPLAIPAAALHPELSGATDAQEYIFMAIAAVFSGAVFGDHCSPFSDTTIVPKYLKLLCVYIL